MCVRLLWLYCRYNVLERSILTHPTFSKRAQERRSLVGLVQLCVDSFNSSSSSGLKTSCSDIFFLIFQKLHVFEAYLCSGLNFVLGSGWNTSVGPDSQQLTKWFSVPERNTLISWETTVCHMFFVCVHLGSMLKHCLAWRAHTIFMQV